MFANLLSMFLTKDMVARLARTVLQAAGSSLATYGILEGSQIEVLVGIGVTLVTTIYTAIASKKKVEQVAELKAVIADVVPPNDPRLGTLQ